MDDKVNDSDNKEGNGDKIASQMEVAPRYILLTVFKMLDGRRTGQCC